MLQSRATVEPSPLLVGEPAGNADEPNEDPTDSEDAPKDERILAMLGQTIDILLSISFI